MPKFQRHVFVCVNERAAGDSRGCCKSRGAEAVLEAFKEKLHAKGLKRIVRPNKAGCLDQCEQGSVVVVYPDAVWYGHVQPADVDEIIESHILGGKPVARLVIPDEKLTGIDPHAAKLGGKA
jgi:(2Fe-2S) ferredoxin